jgi:predicted transcriptional regulator of viral defense system
MSHVEVTATADIAASDADALAAARFTDEMRQRFADMASDIIAPQIEAALRPKLDEIAATAMRSLDADALRQLAEAVSRTAIERAGLIEAADRAGYRAALYALAADHLGYVTTDMAGDIGVPAVEVRKIAARGGLTNVARGLYRVDGIDGGDRAPFAEAVYRVGAEAHLHGESVLAFHDLALVNPTRIKVATTRRVRRQLPDHIQLVHATVEPGELTEYDGVPSATVERAIRDSIGSVMSERLIEATRRAADEGLIRRRRVDLLLAEIAAA